MAAWSPKGLDMDYKNFENQKEVESAFNNLEKEEEYEYQIFQS